MIILRSVVLLLGLTLSSWTFASTTATRIVIVGDSLTEGYGVSQERAYPALVQKKAKAAGKSWDIVNAGVSGSTTASALSRVTWQLKQKPDVLVLALGANDGLRGLDVKASEKNLGDAIAAAQKAGVEVILFGMKVPPNYGLKYASDFEGMYPRLAKQYKIPLLPFMLEGVAGHSDLNQSDAIHPNEKGHVILADLIYPMLAKHISTKKP